MKDSDRRQLKRLTEILDEVRVVQVERDDLIRSVLLSGARVSEVMEVTGLTKARVYQIKKAFRSE